MKHYRYQTTPLKRILFLIDTVKLFYTPSKSKVRFSFLCLVGGEGVFWDYYYEYLIFTKKRFTDEKVNNHSPCLLGSEERKNRSGVKVVITSPSPSLHSTFLKSV